jgi:hypothetical protein
LACNEEIDGAKEEGHTSPKEGGTADVVTIDFSVDLDRSATWAAAIVEVARSRVADGIGTSSTSPLEVSSVCRRK